jgi:hypothetical protein
MVTLPSTSRMVGLALLLVMCALPAVALGHAERWTYFPERSVGAVPKHRTSGPSLVVCKKDSAKRIHRIWSGNARKATRMRRQRLGMLSSCGYRHIQAAVDAAKTGYRILIMPGVYREEPSRRVPVAEERCSGDEYWEDSGDNHVEGGRVPTFLHQYHCPNARSLIAIIGDSLDEDRECDRKCNLQIQGMGRGPRDVLLVGDRLKHDVVRVDRADGIQLRNLAAEQGAYNNIDVVETNGFRLTKLVSRWAQNYGILTFTSDHGLYDRINTYGNGDSGVYPGSGPEYHCAGYGIEIKRVNSHHNLLGAAGTAGNGTWVHDSRFHHNGGGMAEDSFAPGHPGMPQDCSRWERNQLYSNNHNYYAENQELCDDEQTPFEKRPKQVVCPQFQVVIGAGMILYGVNENIYRDNWIWDQWRNGVRIFGVPAAIRGENDPAKQYDTSHGNKFIGNTFGLRPDGTRDRNGLDIYWDEQGIRNCWEGNEFAPGASLTSDPAELPTCASGGSNNLLGNQRKLAQEVSCATWDPQTNPQPPGCIWMQTPEEPPDE